MSLFFLLTITAGTPTGSACVAAAPLSVCLSLSRRATGSARAYAPRARAHWRCLCLPSHHRRSLHRRSHQRRRYPAWRCLPSRHRLPSALGFRPSHPRGPLRHSKPCPPGKEPAILPECHTPLCSNVTRHVCPNATRHSCPRRHTPPSPPHSSARALDFLLFPQQPWLGTGRLSWVHILSMASVRLVVFFSHSAHFSHMSEPILPISHLEILVFQGRPASYTLYYDAESRPPALSPALSSHRHRRTSRAWRCACLLAECVPLMQASLTHTHTLFPHMPPFFHIYLSLTRHVCVARYRTDRRLSRAHSDTRR